MHKGPIVRDTACNVATVSTEGSVSCTKYQLYGNSTSTGRSCEKEYLRSRCKNTKDRE